MKAAVAMASILLMLASCNDKSAEAGLTGPNRITGIPWSVASGEPFFSAEITIDRLDRAKLSMENANGRLPDRVVQSPSGSFESIAKDLADFRPLHGNKRSDCRGYSDAFPVTINWRYERGNVTSYSARPGCPRPDEQRFLEAAASIASRVHLQSWINQASIPR